MYCFNFFLRSIKIKGLALNILYNWFMLSKLTRSSFQRMMVRGGGHGWTRPDPPLNEKHEHKREVFYFMKSILYLTWTSGFMMMWPLNMPFLTLRCTCMTISECLENGLFKFPICLQSFAVSLDSSTSPRIPMYF